LTYKVKLTVFANNAARKLNPEIKKAAKAVLQELGENPFFGKELQAELSGFRSYRFMRYRIIYKGRYRKQTSYSLGNWTQRDIYESLGDSLLKLKNESK
jgi:mRNA-degrading endonuclease RelE of RelBE toxin-antitoxin system